MRVGRLLIALAIFVSLSACRQRVDPETEKDLDTPVVPAGFNEKSLEKIKCPRDGAPLRLATKREVAKINDRIGALKIYTMGGKQRIDFIDAALLRPDGKLAYRIENAMPLIDLNEALVLDEQSSGSSPKK